MFYRILNKKSALFIFSLILIFPCLQFGQIPAGTIKGHAAEAGTRSPMIGTTIVVKNTKMGATTDENGNFEIGRVPAGTYTIEFRSIGFAPAAITDVLVRPGRTTNVSCELHELAVETEGVVVNGGYFQDNSVSNMGIVTFNSEEIRRSPGSMGDASRILMALPSVSKVSDDNNDLIVRGGSPLENGFYIDGIPVPNINHFPNIGSTGGPIGILNVDFIDGFNFLTSGFSSDYGDRLSSVIDIRFREGNRDEVDLQADLNWAGFGGGAEGPLPGGDGSWLFSFKRSYLDLFSKASGWGMVIRYGDAQAKVTYDLNKRHKISMLNIFAYDYETFGREDALEQGSNYYGAIDNFQNTSGLSWKALWSSDFYSLTSISYAVQNFTNNFDKVNTSAKFYVSDNTETSLTFRNTNFLAISKTEKVEFGLDAAAMNGSYNYTKFPDIDRLGFITPEYRVHRNVNPLRTGIFFTFIYNPAETIRLSAGGRMDHYSQNNATLFSPRAAFSWDITSLLKLNINGGIFHQMNPLVIISQKPGFAALKNLKAHHLGAGIEYLLAEDTKATLEIYNKYYSSLPQSPDDPSLCVIDGGLSGSSFGSFNSLESSGKAYSRGIEMLVQKKMSDDLYGMISFSYFRSRYQAMNGTWHDRQYDNKYMFSFMGGYKPSADWEFSLRWTYAGGGPYTPFDQALSLQANTGIIDAGRINTARYPDYHSLNLRIDKKFFFTSQSLDIYLSVWNAYNRKNISEFYWNSALNKAEAIYQWTIMPIFGIEYEM